MATGVILTSLPMTMVPVRSLMTILAGRSASTVSDSISEINSTVRVEYDGGTSTTSRPELSARATGMPGEPKCLLIASTTRVAVVKSDWRSWSFKCDDGWMEGGVRSTIAPSGVRPTVG